MTGTSRRSSPLPSGPQPLPTRHWRWARRRRSNGIRRMFSILVHKDKETYSLISGQGDKPFFYTGALPRALSTVRSYAIRITAWKIPSKKVSGSQQCEVLANPKGDELLASPVRPTQLFFHTWSGPLLLRLRRGDSYLFSFALFVRLSRWSPHRELMGIVPAAFAVIGRGKHWMSLSVWDPLTCAAMSHL